MFSPKFELVTYSWPSAEETRKNSKGHSVVSPNALCYKHSGSRLGGSAELRCHQRLARFDVLASAPPRLLVTVIFTGFAIPVFLSW